MINIPFRNVEVYNTSMQVQEQYSSHFCFKDFCLQYIEILAHFGFPLLPMLCHLENGFCYVEEMHLQLNAVQKSEVQHK